MSWTRESTSSRALVRCFWAFIATIWVCTFAAIGALHNSVDGVMVEFRQMRLDMDKHALRNDFDPLKGTPLDPYKSTDAESK